MMSKRKTNSKKKRILSKTKSDMDFNFENFQPLKMTISPTLFITKREYLAQKIVPPCPVVPPKLRRCYGRTALNTEPSFGQAKLLTFGANLDAKLSVWYRRDIREPYFDQVFYRKIKIGEGSFGCVYKAICRDDNKLYAIKHFNSNHPRTTKYIEVENMEKIGFHKNLLNFFMAWEEGENVFIKMECCQLSLAQYSKINHNIQENQLHEILHDVIQGLRFIHSQNFVHLDIKPDNIMMDKGHYKLGDFGLLYSIKTCDKSERLSSEGDSKYLAPEVLSGIYTPKADIFAFGVTLLELATDFVMPSNGCVWHALRAGGMPSNITEKVSCSFIMLICKMMLYDPEDRPTAGQINNCSLITAVMARDELVDRTDYARLIALGTPAFTNIFNADIRRVLSDIVDSEESNMFQTPINRSVTRKIAFSPGGDGIPRRMNPKNGTPTKEYRRSPRMKLFL